MSIPHDPRIKKNRLVSAASVLTSSQWSHRNLESHHLQNHPSERRRFWLTKEQESVIATIRFFYQILKANSIPPQQRYFSTSQFLTGTPPPHPGRVSHRPPPWEPRALLRAPKPPGASYPDRRRQTRSACFVLSAWLAMWLETMLVWNLPFNNTKISASYPVHISRRQPSNAYCRDLTANNIIESKQRFF